MEPLGIIGTHSATLLVLTVILVSILVRAIFGFGNALVAMPLLALFMDIRVATPLVALTGTIAALFIIAAHWRSVTLRGLWGLSMASVCGIPIGIIFLRGTHEALVKIVLGAVILVFSLYSLLRPTFLKLATDRFAWIFGLAAGILGGACNTNGPPVVMYGSMRQWAPEQFRVTMQGYFVLMGVLIAAGHGLGGLWTREVWRLTALSFPMVVFSVFAGNWIAKRIPARRFSHLVHLLLIAVACVLFVQSIGS